MNLPASQLLESLAWSCTSLCLLWARSSAFLASCNKDSVTRYPSLYITSKGCWLLPPLPSIAREQST